MIQLVTSHQWFLVSFNCQEKKNKLLFGRQLNQCRGSKLEKDFISPTTLSDNFLSSYVLALLSSIVYPLLVFKDCGNVNARKYFCALPKRNWCKYFDDKIVVTEEVSEEDKSEEEDSDVDGDQVTDNDSFTNESGSEENSEYE